MEKKMIEKIDEILSNGYSRRSNFKITNKPMRESESFKIALRNQGRVSAVRNVTRRSFLRTTGAASAAVMGAQLIPWDDSIAASYTSAGITVTLDTFDLGLDIDNVNNDGRRFEMIETINGPFANLPGVQWAWGPDQGDTGMTLPHDDGSVDDASYPTPLNYYTVYAHVSPAGAVGDLEFTVGPSAEEDGNLITITQMATLSDGRVPLRVTAIDFSSGPTRNEHECYIQVKHAEREEVLLKVPVYVVYPAAFKQEANIIAQTVAVSSYTHHAEYEGMRVFPDLPPPQEANRVS